MLYNQLEVGRCILDLENQTTMTYMVIQSQMDSQWNWDTEISTFCSSSFKVHEVMDFKVHEVMDFDMYVR